MTAGEKYFLCNIEKLQPPIQMHLSKKQPFCQFLAPFIEPTPNFKHFEKKDDRQSLDISETTECERHG